MSRCVAFPPPGYAWNGVSGDDLISLLKLRKERAEAKKKMKKEEKRRKKKSELEDKMIKRKRSRTPQHSGSSERSIVSEELGQPEVLSHMKASTYSPELRTTTAEPAITWLMKSFSSHQTKARGDDKAGLHCESSSSENEMQHKESSYQDLIVNWVSLSIESLQQDENLNWLYSSAKRQPCNNYKTAVSQAGSTNASLASSALDRTAQYLPHADIYALPFVVPL